MGILPAGLRVKMAAISDAGSSRACSELISAVTPSKSAAAENKRQVSPGKQQLHHQTASGKQAAADNQAFEKALMRGIKTGNVAAGGD